jgi:hypothetical protein
MENEYVHNNPRDPTKERFERLEVQFSDIGHNMNLLMVALSIKLRPFRDDGGSKSENRLEGKSKY